MRTLLLMLIAITVVCCPAVTLIADVEQPSISSEIQTLAEAKPDTPSADLRMAAGQLTKRVYDADSMVTQVMPALDHATPLGANWLRTVVETVFERTMKQGRPMPVDSLRKFALDRSHSPRARRLAYEWLVKAAPEQEAELLDAMLDDPSVELRRDAVARLIEQADASDDVAMYRRALDAARDLDQIDLLLEKLKQHDVKIDEQKLFGYLVDWQLVGPFDNTGEQGFGVAYEPEKEMAQDVALPDLTAKTYAGKHGPVAWKAYQSNDPRGLVDLNAAVDEEKAVCAYAMAQFEVASEQPAQLRMTTYNAVKVWLNGKLVDEHNVYHGGASYDQYIAPVTLKQGVNTIMVKICQNEQTQSWANFWAMQLRVTDATGGAITMRTTAPKTEN